uniref:Uncharacterized protein n=1 Tax=Anguilla anguilla TaxID=7936 RepID=A0A0E9RC16_ANGAN
MKDSAVCGLLMKECSVRFINERVQCAVY